MHKFRYGQYEVNVTNAVCLVTHFPRSVTFKNPASLTRTMYDENNVSQAES